jgi:nucleotide-binding universal stress UspA family protein
MLQAALDTSTGIHVKSILLATDFSPASDGPIHHALTIAKHYGAVLHLAHVVPSVGLNIAGREASANATTAAAMELLALEEGLAARSAFDGVEHDLILCSGHIWVELQAVIERAAVDLVVVGTHARRGLRKVFLGSVAERIFRQAGCPVLTVGPCSPSDVPTDAGGTPGPMLFATDFSEASLAAMPYATSFASQWKTHVALAHILSPSALAVDRQRWPTVSDVAELELEAQMNARLRLERLAERGGCDSDAAFSVEFGEPAEGIVRAARALQVQAIVMGLKHTAHVEAASHVRWSTAYDVACAAGCPVLTVRESRGQ